MFKKLFKMGGSSDFGKMTPVISVAGVIIILCLWWIEAFFQVIPPKILPGPIEVLQGFGSLFSDYNLIENTWFSIKLNLISYIWAIAISLPLGLLIALYPINNLVFGRYINSVRFAPLPAMTGLFISIWGLSLGMKEAFLTVGLVIYILPEVANRVNDLQNPANDKDNVFLQTANTLGASNWQKFKYVYWPYVTSKVSPSIRSLAAISWSYVTISELIYKDGGISGIGALISTMFRQSHIPEAWAGLFLIMAIGVAQDFLFKRLEIFLFPHMYNKKKFSIYARS